MRVLIISAETDIHAKAVCWGLQQYGADCTLWSWSKFPAKDLASIKLQNGDNISFSLNISGQNFQNPFDAIWIRRTEASIPPENAHLDDVEVIKRESKEFLKGILPFLGHTSTKFINTPLADIFCDNKLRQLQLAHLAGFTIPETLMTNDIDELKTFFYKHDGNVVFKAFSPAVWNNQDGSRTIQKTAKITKDILSNGFSVRACPAIFQENIEKSFEIRVTVMGDEVISAAIYSQRNKATIDWRFENGFGNPNLEIYEIDEGLKSKCLYLCKLLGVEFGAIDLIVKPDQSIVFLEINCAGQFLWKEFDVPEIKILDTFCRFLLGIKISNGLNINLNNYLESNNILNKNNLL